MIYCKRLVWLSFFALLSVGVIAQPKEGSEVWNTLSFVKFTQGEMPGKEKNNKMTSLISDMEDKEIQVRGYIIPLTGKKAQNHFMFSAFPYAMCYFCGNAGPETVMEVYMQIGKKVEFSEKPILLKGKFKWHSKDLTDVMFKLEEAEVINQY